MSAGAPCNHFPEPAESELEIEYVTRSRVA